MEIAPQSNIYLSEEEETLLANYKGKLNEAINTRKDSEDFFIRNKQRDTEKALALPIRANITQLKPNILELDEVKVDYKEKDLEIVENVDNSNISMRNRSRVLENSEPKSSGRIVIQPLKDLESRFQSEKLDYNITFLPNKEINSARNTSNINIEEGSKEVMQDKENNENTSNNLLKFPKFKKALEEYSSCKKELNITNELKKDEGIGLNETSDINKTKEETKTKKSTVKSVTKTVHSGDSDKISKSSKTSKVSTKKNTSIKRPVKLPIGSNPQKKKSSLTLKSDLSKDSKPKLSTNMAEKLWKIAKNHAKQCPSLMHDLKAEGLICSRTSNEGGII